MSAKRLCSVEECNRAHMARGLCCMHYRRKAKHGTTDKVLAQADPLGRLMAKVIKRDGHWLWCGARNPGGYGVIGVGRREEGTRLAHRLSYELLVGPIPEGLHIDHLCVTPACVNPEHLEAVTQVENNRRERERQLQVAA